MRIQYNPNFKILALPANADYWHTKEPHFFHGFGVLPLCRCSQNFLGSSGRAVFLRQISIKFNGWVTFPFKKSIDFFEYAQNWLNLRGFSCIFKAPMPIVNTLVLKSSLILTHREAWAHCINENTCILVLRHSNF